jgi:hypothetical protein
MSPFRLDGQLSSVRCSVVLWIYEDAFWEARGFGEILSL